MDTDEKSTDVTARREHRSKLSRVDYDDNAAERWFAQTWGVVRFCLWVFGLLCIIAIVLAAIGIAHLIPG